MKVLYLACEPRIDLSAATGHATHILKTIKGLESKGHSVHRVIAGDMASEKKAKGTFRALKPKLPSGLSVILRDCYALAHDRRFFKYSRRACCGGQYDFIYERATAYHRTGCRLSSALRIPLVLEVNSPLEELITLHGCSPALIPIASYIEHWTARKAQAIVVGSNGMGRYLTNRGVNPEKIFTIYPTAEDQFFSLLPDSRKIRQTLRVDGKVVAGFVGSMPRSKRLDLLLKAAVEVRRSSTEVHFLIVGDGPVMQESKRFVHDHDLENVVTFTGRVPYEQVPEYSAAMDMCIIPSATWYGSPTKLFEYAASGKPIIAPRVGPIEELIKDGDNGLLIRPGDISDLATNIMKLAADQSLRVKLGIRLKSEIMREHTWEKNTTKLMKMFEFLRTPAEREKVSKDVHATT